MKKFVALILSCLLILSGCVGPQSSDPSVRTASDVYERDPNLNELGEYPICKEPITLKIMRSQDANVQDFKTNKYTRKIEEYGNVNLEFELVPGGDMQTKLNLIMNSGIDDLPDIVLVSLNQQQITSFADSGMIIPLNKYYENSSYYLKNQLERVAEKDVLKYMTMSDGNIYSVPRYNESLHNELSRVLWIYKPWLDKLGMDVPETYEEYKAVLKAFNDNDMNGNGDKNDEIPLLDTTQYRSIYAIMQTFVGFVTGPVTNDLITFSEDGKLEYAFMTDGWRKGLTYLNELCESGLFSPASFTIDEAQFRTILANEENKVGSFTFTSTSVIPVNSNRRREFVPVLLKGESGRRSFTFEPSMPAQVFFVTRTCENPEAAFRIGDLMCSDEMTIWARWGEKGVDWIEPSPGSKAVLGFLGYEPMMEPILQFGGVQNAHWNNMPPGFRTYEVAAGMVAGSDSSQDVKADAIRSIYEHISYDLPYGTIIYTKDELEEYADIFVAAESYVKEKVAMFISGKENIDTNWNSYINELEQIGVQRAIEIAQTAFDRMNN